MLCLAAWWAMAGVDARAEVSSAGASAQLFGHEAYQPAGRMSGEVRVWGSPADQQLIASLQRGFRAFHPDVKFSTQLYGPESTFASIYTAVADLAFMARELREPLERMAYEWVMLSKPFLVEIATSAIDADRPASTLAVFVHRTNPLTRLTLPELDALLGAEHRRGGKPLQVWGDLGLKGEWAARPIRVHGPDLDSVDAQFLRERVMRGSHKWNPAYEPAQDHADVARAVAEDRWAIGVAPLHLRNDQIKPLEISHGEGAPFHAPVRTAIADRTYPLARAISIAAAHTEKAPLKPVAREFLRYVLSREGQEVIAANGVYVPLTPSIAAQQRARIE